MPIKKSPAETRERREEVLDFMESIGPYSVPIKVLAEKWKVTIKVIYNDIKVLVNKIDFKDINLEGKKIIMGMKKDLGRIEGMKVEGSVTQIRKAIDLSNKTAEIFTKLQEQYGFKEKIADKVQIDAGLDVIRLTKEERIAEIKRILKR